MGRSCCVPGCRSNYGKSNVSAFQFPKDRSLREKWLMCIRRKDFSVTDHSVVCINHFDRRFLVTEDVFKVIGDNPIHIPRKKPKLIEGAYPTIFPGRHVELPQPRKSPGQKHKEAINKGQKPKSIKKKVSNKMSSRGENREKSDPEMFNNTRKDQNNSTEEASETEEDEQLTRIENEIDRYENLHYEAEHFDNCVVMYEEDRNLFENNTSLNEYNNVLRKEEKEAHSHRSLRLLPILKTYNADFQNQPISGICESNETQILVYNEDKRQYDIPPTETSLDEFSTYLILPRTYVNMPDNDEEHSSEATVKEIEECHNCRKCEDVGNDNVQTTPKCECNSCQLPSIPDKIEVNSFYDIPYSCPLCEQKLYTKFSIRKHIKWHMNMEMYTCNYCGQHFSCKSSINNHMLMHGEGYKSDPSSEFGPKTFKPLMCKKCGEVVIFRARLKDHLKCRSEKMWYDCTQCDKTFPTEKLLKLHLLLHAKFRYFKCEICEKCFTDGSTWSKHSKFVHTDEKPYQCDQCGNRFKRHKALMAHLPIHDNNVQHICDTCGKSFKFISNFRAHRLIHQPDYPLIKQSKKLNQSSNKKTPVKKSVKQMVTCTICGKSVVRPNLYHHLMSHKDAPRKCDVCNKFYKNELYLKAHIRLIHREEEQCQCKVCGKQFRQMRLLKHHEKIHLGVKNFLCTLCGKKFVYASNLHAHLKCHKGVRNYECAECGKKFVFRYRLKEHMFTHVRGKTLP